MKYLIIFTTILLSMLILGGSPVMAQYESCDLLAEDENTTLADILDCRAEVAKKLNEGKGFPENPYFEQPAFFDPENFTLLSWLSVLVNIAIIGIVLYWVYLVIKAAFMIISSMGNPGKLQEGAQQIAAVMKSIAAIFIFIFILIIAGSFFGIGNIWEWPNSFRQCPSHENRFLFTVRLENPGQQIDC